MIQEKNNYKDQQPAAGPIIRLAGFSDVDTVYEIMTEAWKELKDKKRFFIDDKAFIRERIKDKGFCLVAECDGKPAAYLWVDFPGLDGESLGRYLSLPDEELLRTAVLDSVAVRKEYRGRGFQKLLIEEAVKRLHGMGYMHMLAKTHPENRASLKSFMDRGFAVMLYIHEKGTERVILYRSFCGEEKKEYFRLFNERGEALPRIKERRAVHRDGDLHGAAHTWIMERYGGGIRVLLQKRSADKDSFPNCYDCSSAGHVDAGEEFIATAIRELREELGLEAEEEDFTFLFKQIVGGDYEFGNAPFKNHELNYVYLLNKPVDIERLVYEPGEIQGLEWKDGDEVLATLRAACKDTRKDAPETGYCMWLHEFERVYEYVKKSGNNNEEG